MVIYPTGTTIKGPEIIRDCILATWTFERENRVIQHIGGKMMKKGLAGFIPLCIMLSVMTWGCAQNTTTAQDGIMKPAAAQQQSENVYKGKIVGKSNKAKTISIEVGKGDKAQTMMVRFDDKTKGLEHAEKDEAAIITWEMRGSDKFATVIKPKLAQLPEGITEIGVEELFTLISGGTSFTLADARPKARYDQAHLPGAVSIPVPALKEKKEAVLPPDKNKLLVFYCGGYT